MTYITVTYKPVVLNLPWIYILYVLLNSFKATESVLYKAELSLY